MKAETKLFNRYFILTLLIALCINIGQSIGNNAVSVYIDSLNMPTSFTGFIGIPYAIVAIISRIFSGYLADNKGRRMTMVFGCLLFAVSTLVFGLVRAAWLLVIFRSLQGAGYAFPFTGATAANLDVTPKGKEKLGVGIFWIPLAIAIAVSGKLVLTLSAGGSYTPVFVASGVILALGSVFSLFCTYEKKNPVARSANGGEGVQYKGISKFVEVRALKAAAIMLTFAIAMSSITAFIMLFATVRNYANTGLFFTIGAVSMFVGNLASAKLHDKLGAVPTLITAFAFYGVMIVAMAFSASEAVFLVMAAAYGYIQGISSPVLCTLAVENLPADRRGAGSSTLYMMLDVGIGIGSFLWGIIIDISSYTVMYCGAGVFAALAIVLTLVFYGRKKKTA